MGKFLIKVTYTSGSWARLISRPDDRILAVRGLMEHVGGSLEQLYWMLSDKVTAVSIADLPDTVTAAAVITTGVGTGAFMSGEAHELLTQHQLSDALMLARAGREVYSAPGSSAVAP
jgi:uncharacterized protein with GYD domain